MEKEQKLLYSGGYDILKFMMACLIVAIHSQAFYGPYSSIYLKPITGVAVPVFFVLSSFFYFLRINDGRDIQSSLKRYLQRIGLLYLFWFIVNLPIIYHKKHYFVENGFPDVLRLIMDVIFRATFSGSWFFSASCLAIVLFSVFYRKMELRIIMLVFSVFLWFYINCIDLIPNQYHGIYDWWAKNIRDEVRLTVLEALPWVGMGMILSSPQKMKIEISKMILSVLLVILLCFLVYTYSNGCDFYYALSKFLLVIVIVLYAANLKIKVSTLSKHYRKLSILFYMIHFEMVILVPLGVRYLFHVDIYREVGGVIYYFIILLFTFVFSELYLYLSTKSTFYWLKYGY